MKLFTCQNCGHPLYFESTQCKSCGMALGYLPEAGALSALDDDGGTWRARADGARYRYCANRAHDVCNWLVAADGDRAFCAACRHNRMIPDLSRPDHLMHWRRVEVAKHRLFYSLIRLRLPLTIRPEDENGLAFDILSHLDSPTPVMTGHQSGLITINLEEADDAERERRRGQMGEPYRTLLGHFRHEIAHYFWEHLVGRSAAIEEFRTIFGDERNDYEAALRRHYAGGPPADWPQFFVSAYASAHPWEDFAETWAHYLHMVDTLETANAFGMSMRPRVQQGSALATALDFDPHDSTDMERIIDAWLPLTFAMNSMNRSMGLQDLYPFTLAPWAIVKLTFIHNRVAAERGQAPASNEALRAVIAGLRRPVDSAAPG